MQHDDLLAGMPVSREQPREEPPLIGAGGRYVPERVLGRGATGLAHLVRRAADGRCFVAKVVQLEQLADNDRGYALGEAYCLGHCNHFAIIRLEEHVDDRTAGTVTLIMEHGDAGDLRLHIKHRAAAASHFSEKDVWQVFVQVCLALDHIHSRKMMHRDIKTNNIFLTSCGLVKVGDFGLSRVFDDSVSHDVADSVVGTPCYIAPELLRGDTYSKKADMWSLGCVLYELMALRRPFDAVRTFEDMRALVAATHSEEGRPSGGRVASLPLEPLPTMYSEELRGIALRLLSPAPADRPSTSELLLLPPGRARLDEFVSNAGKTATIPPELRADIEQSVSAFVRRAEEGELRTCAGTQSQSTC